MTVDYQVIQAGQEHWPFIAGMLADEGLPTDDLKAHHVADFLVSVAGEQVVGAIGLEQLGNHGLLRSLVVSPDARGLGVGCRLVAALERRAAEQGLVRLWLLTLDADAYFAASGFSVANREDAPERVRQCREFADLCPGSAILMTKAIGTMSA